MNHHNNPMMTRRDVLRLSAIAAATAVSATVAPLAAAQAQQTRLAQAARDQLITRPIPSSGEQIPVIGIGTARRYDDPSPEAREELREVLRRFPELGCSVVDTAPSYGTAESVVGELINELGIRDELFLATKVRTRGEEAGKEQIEQSFDRLRTDRIDLIAVHNLVDTQTQLRTLRELKDAGPIRYVGVTTSSDRQYEDLEAVMKAEDLDFIQVDYAIDNRSAGERILPLAADRGIAVMINLPFGRGRVFQAVQDQPLPEWASEFDCETWAQFFLKYIVSHPAVTCAIPGTARVRYVLDNTQAARGRLPDAEMRKRMEQHLAAVENE